MEGATLQLVREFNATDTARRLYGDAVEKLAEAINARAEHTPAQVAEMLGVGRVTVSDWIRAGVLSFEERRLHKGRIEPMGPRQRWVMGRQFVKADTLHRFLAWEAPH
jgi:transposase